MDYTLMSRNIPERGRMTPEWNGMDKNGTGIYRNEPEWHRNILKWGGMRLEWTRIWSAEPEMGKMWCFFFFFFLMGAGEAFHVLSVNNFVSFWQVHRVMTNQNKVEHMWANLKTYILFKVAVWSCFSHASAAFFYTSEYTSDNLIIARHLYPISCFLCFSWLVWAMESQRKLPR